MKVWYIKYKLEDDGTLWLSTWALFHLTDLPGGGAGKHINPITQPPANLVQDHASEQAAINHLDGLYPTNQGWHRLTEN